MYRRNNEWPWRQMLPRFFFAAFGVFLIAYSALSCPRWWCVCISIGEGIIWCLDIATFYMTGYNHGIADEIERQTIVREITRGAYDLHS